MKNKISSLNKIKSIFLKSKIAFSLFEISMVLIIISILILGISSGVDMYNDFKLNLSKKASNELKAVIYDLGEFAFHFDASDEKSFVAGEKINNSQISQINNIIPKNKLLLNSAFLNLTQTNSTLKPLYIENSINNSFPGIKFFNYDSNNVFKSLYLTTNLKGSDVYYYDSVYGNSVTFFIVQHLPNYINANARGDLWTWIAAYGGYNKSLNLSTGDDINLNFATCCPAYRNRIGTKPLATRTKPHLIVVIRDGCAVEFRVNKINVSPISGFCYKVEDFYSHALNLGNNFEGYLAEIIVAKDPISKKNIEIIEDLLIRKWLIK
jgi:hypothetical protein